MRPLLLVLALSVAPLGDRLRAETGYDLWLRYRRVSDPARLAEYRRVFARVSVEETSPTGRVTRDELTLALRGLLDTSVTVGFMAGGHPGLIVGTAIEPPQ